VTSSAAILSARGGYQKPAALTIAQTYEMNRLWERCPDLSAKQIGERFGVTKNTVIGRAHRGRWVRAEKSLPPPKEKPKREIKLPPHALENRFSFQDLLDMQGLWDAGETIISIAAKFGVTDNGIYKLAWRQEWMPRPTAAELAAPAPTTLQQRLAALHRRLNAVLEETRERPEWRVAA